MLLGVHFLNFGLSSGIVSVLLSVYFLDFTHSLVDFLGLMDLTDWAGFKLFFSGLFLGEHLCSVETCGIASVGFSNFEKSIGDDARLVLEVMFSVGFACSMWIIWNFKCVL